MQVNESDSIAIAGRLDVVATPIGNLADAAPRMREALAEADLVLAEDTRHSGRLLQQFGLKRPLLALHEHNEADVVAGLVGRLVAGERFALVSDAGTPTVSDPGYRLIRAARAAGVRVSPVPGPSAVIAALSAAGLPTDRFCFDGFLPARDAARRERLAQLVAEPRTLVLFESVHRIEAALRDMVVVFGAEREACLARELTKRHEQIVSGTLAHLLDALATGKIPTKGEFVVLLGGAPASAGASEEDAEARRLLSLLLEANLPLKQAARLAADFTGSARNGLYDYGLTLKNR